jgi:hypothetical protein
VTQIQPIDEFFNTTPAFNLYHHGSLAYQVVSFIPPDGSPVNLLQNAMTFATLLVLGNNYYGLRMASVLAGLGVFVLLYLLVRRESNPSASEASALNREGVPLLALAYLVSDFSFNVASRADEPTIFRMLAMTVVLVALPLATRASKGSSERESQAEPCHFRTAPSS